MVAGIDKHDEIGIWYRGNNLEYKPMIKNVIMIKNVTINALICCFYKNVYYLHDTVQH